MKYFVIIPSAGTGNRFGSKIPKQYIKVKGKEILAYSINVFERCKLISGIVISSDLLYFRKIQKIIKHNKFQKIIGIVQGGKTRQDSVINAFEFIDCEDDDIIIVHDAARPNLNSDLLQKVIKSAEKYGACVLGTKISDTVSKTDNKEFIKQIVPRENLYALQTPQAAKYKLLKAAYNKVKKTKFIGTDETSVLKYSNISVKIVEGDESNIKITNKFDFKKFKQIKK